MDELIRDGVVNTKQKHRRSFTEYETIYIDGMREGLLYYKTCIMFLMNPFDKTNYKEYRMEISNDWPNSVILKDRLYKKVYQNMIFYRKMILGMDWFFREYYKCSALDFIKNIHETIGFDEEQEQKIEDIMYEITSHHVDRDIVVHIFFKNEEKC